MGSKKRLFWILWAMGFAGILSTLLIDLPAVIAMVPLPPDREVPPIWLIKPLSLVQPAIILTVAVLTGVGLASKVGFSSPAIESYLGGGDWFAAFRPQILPGIIGGLAGGLAIILTAAILTPYLAPEAVKLIGEFSKVLPIPTRLLYGGITEELLLRWGLMSLLVWLMWRLFQKRQGTPKGLYVIAAILFSSFIFGIGHLPIAFMLFHEPTAVLMLFVVVANSIFGLIAGVLYWKKGLESAMIAHIMTHIVLFTGSLMGRYF